MVTRNWFCGSLTLVLTASLAAGPGEAWGQSHSGHSGHGGMPGGHSIGTGAAVGAVSGLGLGFAVGGGYATYGFPFYSTIGFDGLPFSYVPPLLLVPPLASPSMFGFGPAGPRPPFGMGRLVAGPMPEPGLFGGPLPQPGAIPKPRRPEPARSAQLVTYGDRHFRAGNLHKAAERYSQAVAADPTAAAPRVRMAQIALNRGQYAQAAEFYRDALTNEPGWLLHAPDIQAIYGEPGDFARQIAKLETHLQADPNDRDAWFVLGAQWYLSGQTRKASDVFLRLSDRKYDSSLAAFIDASTPRQPAPQ